MDNKAIPKIIIVICFVLAAAAVVLAAMNHGVDALLNYFGTMFPI